MATSPPPSVVQVGIDPSLKTRISTLLSDHRDQLEEYSSLLLKFNERQNLISRQSADHVADHHILHSMALASKPFETDSIVVDWGTGGGLPAIPLAIVQPDVQIVAVDKVEKKTRAVKSMAVRLNLKNLDVWKGRAEEWSGRCDYSVSRATTSLKNLWSWHSRVSDTESKGASKVWKKGLLCLKGGDLEEEILALGQDFPGLEIDVYDLAHLLDHLYYESKMLIHVH
ncbi:MAG: class I SAM-dependent methyltransferase [Bacteroidetes bacterium]|nr:class I SAM-dependent methyltransferase [Bacteroidota bacterium]